MDTQLKKEMTWDDRLHNARILRRQYRDPLIIVGGVLLVILGMLLGMRLFPNLIDDYNMNLYASLLNVALGVLVLDRLNERRAIAQEKQALFAQLGSPDNVITRQAIKVLWARGWLQDGSAQKANLWEANLEKGDLGQCDLRGANLKRANLRGARLWTDLRGAILIDADLSGVLLFDPYDAGHGEAQFDETTILPDNKPWDPDTDMSRFIDSQHPHFWRSSDSRSPAFQVERSLHIA